MTREEKTNLLNELLEYEENNDIGNLTRAERREFKQWISEALETLEEFEKAQIITSGRLNGRTNAYKCDDGHMETETMPVIHAKWINSTPNYVNGYYGNSYYCSACKYYYSKSPKEMLYCPYCGAKMDEIDEEDEEESEDKNGNNNL